VERNIDKNIPITDRQVCEKQNCKNKVNIRCSKKIVIDTNQTLTQTNSLYYAMKHPIAIKFITFLEHLQQIDIMALNP